MKPSEPFDRPSGPTARVTRRDVLRVSGAAALAASCPALLSGPASAQAAGKRIRLPLESADLSAARQAL